MEKIYTNAVFHGLMHGADYNPDQWLGYEGIWDEDMRLMKHSHCNTMTVGMFLWSKIEKTEGVFDFTILDSIIDNITANGGKIILGTPSAAMPQWLAQKYPEVLRTDKNEVHTHYKDRQNHCPTVPIYREKVRAFNTRLAERYKDNPNIIAIHISNEFGLEECFCPHCKAAFRDYLRNKFDGDIEKLNNAYWNTFWNREYDSFEQIEPPSALADKNSPSLRLDWRRFVSHQITDFMAEEIKTFKELCPHIPVTTNFINAWNCSNWEMSKELDFISWDSYPAWHSPEHLQQAYTTAFWQSLYRSMKQKPWMLMESVPGAVNWRAENKLKRPGMDKLSALQAVANGSDSVMYFQFRKSRGGCEQYHGSIVDHVGHENTRVFRAVQDTGITLEKLSEIAGTVTKARVGIIYDWDVAWALDGTIAFDNKDKVAQYVCDAENFYRVFWKLGIPVDVIEVDADYSKYDLVIAPMLYIANEATIDRIEKYVKNGGVFYGTYLLGMVQDDCLCHLGGFPGGGLKEVFGIWNEELDVLYPGEAVKVRDCNGSQYSGGSLCELIHAQGAEVLARYDSEFYAGMPACTVNSYGKGKAYYQAFRDDGSFRAAMLGDILNALDIHGEISQPMPEGVTNITRTDGENIYLFVQNFTENPVQIKLDYTYADMESGSLVTEATVPGFGIHILKRSVMV